MNLLDKKWMVPALGLALFLFSCDEENKLGQEINPSDDRISIEYKEFNLPSANIFYDSVRTDNAPYLWVGAYNDAVYGDMIFEGYANFTPVTSLLPGDTSVMDSVVLQLEVGDWYGQFPKPQEIQVKELDDIIYSGTVYSSDRKQNLKEGSIGSIDKSFHPSLDTIIKFDLDTNFISGVFQKLKDLEVYEPFEPGELPGLGFQPDENSSIITGFNLASANSRVTIHYHNIGGEDSLTYVFRFNGTASYHHVAIDRSDSELSLLDDSNEKLVKFNDEGDRIYMNPISGVLPWFDLRDVYDFFDTGDTAIILSAELILPIDIVSTDTSEYERNSTSIRYLFAEIDGSFNGSGPLLAPASSMILSNNGYINRTFTAATGQIDAESYSYSSDVTIFTQSMINDELDPDRRAYFPSSIVVIPTIASGIEQTYLNRDGIQLKVHYAVPNQVE